MEEKIINAMEKLKNEPCKDAMDRLKKMVLSELYAATFIISI